MTQPKAGWEGWDSEFQHSGRPGARAHPHCDRRQLSRFRLVGLLYIGSPPRTRSPGARGSAGAGAGSAQDEGQSKSGLGRGIELKLDAVFEELPGIERKAGDAESVKLHEL